MSLHALQQVYSYFNKGYVLLNESLLILYCRPQMNSSIIYKKN